LVSGLSPPPKVTACSLPLEFCSCYCIFSIRCYVPSCMHLLLEMMATLKTFLWQKIVWRWVN
jgi:hypothetical protein